MPLVFVYGTLREGESNFGYMRRARCVADKASIQGYLIDTGKNYPGLVRDIAMLHTEEQPQVVGEVYEVSVGHLAWLDKLEHFIAPGHPDNNYERIETIVETEGGPLTAWTYLYLHAGEGGIRFWDWKTYRSGQTANGS